MLIVKYSSILAFNAQLFFKEILIKKKLLINFSYYSSRPQKFDLYTYLYLHQVNIIRIGDQLRYFQQYQQRLSGLIGQDQATQRVNQALVLITLGGNDFVNNYYLVPYSFRSRQFALPDYVKYVIFEYKKVLAVN